MVIANLHMLKEQPRYVVLSFIRLISFIKRYFYHGVMVIAISKSVKTFLAIPVQFKG